MKLGIRPERIQRGKPSQNGRHERMHRTLKEDAIKSVKIGRRTPDQQRVFDRFRREYNEERPHEAIGQRPPVELYESSAKCYPLKLISPAYPENVAVFEVDKHGAIAIDGRDLRLSKVLRGEPVGVMAPEDEKRRVMYGPIHLGTLSSSGRFTREHGTSAEGDLCVQSRDPHV